MGLFSKKEKYRKIEQVPITSDTIPVNPLAQVQPVPPLPQIPQLPQTEEESEEMKMLLEVTNYLDKLVIYLKSRLD